jgi:hypothetical protein
MSHTNVASELFLGAESGGTSPSRWSLVCNGDVLIDGRPQNVRIFDRRWELSKRKQWRCQKRDDNTVLHIFLLRINNIVELPSRPSVWWSNSSPEAGHPEQEIVERHSHSC